MNCQQFDQIVVEMARVGSAEAGTPPWALEHARSCPRCAARLSDQQKLTVALRVVSTATGNERAPARVEQALLRTFRAGFDASRPATTVDASPRRAGAMVWRVWTVAAAAMLMLGLVAAWKLWPTLPARPVPHAGTSSPQVTNKKTAEVATAGNGETQPASAVVRQRPRRTARHGGPSKLVATPEQTAATQATRFYPLPYGSGLGLDEGWALVRVQVRRSSLASLGLPVSAGSAASEMLTADLVVGQDGLARGIRFVQ